MKFFSVFISIIEGTLRRKFFIVSFKSYEHKRIIIEQVLITYKTRAHAQLSVTLLLILRERVQNDYYVPGTLSHHTPTRDPSFI